MTSRDRILSAMAHKETDRLPLDFGGTDCSGIHVIGYDKLRKRLGIDTGPIRLSCLVQMIAGVEQPVMDYFHGDAQTLSFKPTRTRLWDSGYGFPVEVPDLWRPEIEPDGRNVIRDRQGIVRQARSAGGYYFDPVSFPLANVQSPAELDAFGPLFDRWDWSAVYDESLADYGVRARKLRGSTDRAIVALWRMHYLQAGQIMRGYEEFMMDLLTDEAMARAIMDRLHVVYMERTQKFLDAVGDAVDIAFFTDDLGTQNGPLLQPELYRKIFKPYWAELIAMVKRRGLKVLMHSCGAVADFIPDLIEIGVDAINPVQISAAGMDPARLKRQFGKDITFWGGGISTQGTLARATPAQVRDEVRRNIDIFAPGGGFVFTPVHNIQPDVPIENILAAFEEAHRYLPLGR